MTDPTNPTKAIVYVTAEGLPDAWAVSDREIELRVTQPDSTVEAVIVVPLVEARTWAADVYAAVTIAYREHTGDPGALTDFDLAGLPSSGRVVFENLADRWHEPVPSLDDIAVELDGLVDGGDDGSGPSSLSSPS